MEKNRSVLIIHSALAIFMGLILVLQLPAEAMERLEPVSASHPDFGSQPVAVVADERIFTLFAALNAAGFDREYEASLCHLSVSACELH